MTNETAVLLAFMGVSLLPWIEIARYKRAIREQNRLSRETRTRPMVWTNLSEPVMQKKEDIHEVG